ncbi:B12-binding domain-containing radical SAM protein [Candidatus Omnitrophota bacterium]
MKIVLANLPWKVRDRWGVRAGSRWPHIKSYQEGDYLPFPFFLAYAAALLKKNGHSVYLIDAIAEKIHYEDFIRKVKGVAPDFIVAETSTASLYNDTVILKRLSKKAKIVVCGPDINITKEDFLKANSFISYVLVGEYEMTLLNLLQHLDKGRNIAGVLGVIYRLDGKVIRNPDRPLLEDLDVLPWPMRESLPMERYFDIPGDLDLPSVQMLSSRGCPFQCIFCAWPQIMYKKGNYRTRSVRDVVDEMEYLVNYYGFKSIYFDDDTWNIGKDRVLEFCKEITSMRDKKRLNVPWAMMARADLMDEGQLVALKKSGLHAVKYGIESADQAMLDRAKKSMDFKKADRMVNLTMAMGINTHLTFTFGLPCETKETVEKTIGYALKTNPVSAQFSITTPYPGTDYFLDLERGDRLLTRDWSEYDGNHKGVFNGEFLTREELVAAKERAITSWGNHCRYRQPARDFPIRKLVFKFWNYIFTKGLSFAIYKVFDYMRFAVKRSELYQRTNMHKIEKGRLKILFGLGKVNILWDNVELTKGVGLFTSISLYKNWSNSSQADWHIIKASGDSVTMRNDWKNLPISQLWRLSIIDENKIDWDIKIIYKEDTTLDMEKAGIMLSEKYDKWIVGDREGEFSLGRNWQEINFKDVSKREVRATRSTPSSRFPDIALEYSIDGISGVLQIQSSSRDLKARFINTNLASRYYYKRGEYNFFKGRILIGT